LKYAQFEAVSLRRHYRRLIEKNCGQRTDFNREVDPCSLCLRKDGVVLTQKELARLVWIEQPTIAESYTT